MTIKELQKVIHANAKAKGFWEEENPNIPERLMLIVSEVSEAMEAHRSGRFTDPVELGWFFATVDDGHALLEVFPEKIKNTFEDELADVVIRVLDLAAYLNIPIADHIEAKMRYNETRPYKHGKAY